MWSVKSLHERDGFMWLHSAFFDSVFGGVLRINYIILGAHRTPISQLLDPDPMAGAQS